MVRYFMTVAAILVSSAPAIAQDRAGADHPLMPRYEGSFIRQYRAPALDHVVMPSGAIVNQNAAANRQTLEGEVTHIDYRIKPATAPLQIERHYKQALDQAGFQIVYQCVGPVCGKDMGSLILNSGKVSPVGFADGLFNDRIRVLVARSGSNWALLHIAEGPDRSQIYQLIAEDSNAGIN